MIQNLKVSLYSRKDIIVPTRTVNIWEWLLHKNEYTPIVEKLRNTSNDKERKRLKKFIAGYNGKRNIFKT